MELEKSPIVGGLSTWTHTHYTMAGSEMVAQRKWTGSHNGSTQTMTAGPVDQYFHGDHLGSIAAITDASKAVLERFSHETWGKRRNATGWTDLATPPVSNHTTRGYTGHEELDVVGLVHMNGRVYDPTLGRFTSPDPFIQYADNPQSYNRYSYVLNNPLSFTDPSGYFLGKLFKKIFRAVKKLVKAVVRVVKSFLKNPEQLVALAIVAIPGAGWASAIGLSSFPTTAAFTQGFASGIIASKGDFEDGLISAVTAVGFSSLHGWDVKGASFGQKALKATAHGAVGGLSSIAQGGSFQSGFLSAGTVQAFSNTNMFDRMGVTSSPDGFGDYAANATVAAVIGGSASAIGGGDFANGAVTGAFSRLFNDLAADNDLRMRTSAAESEARRVTRAAYELGQRGDIGPMSSQFGNDGDWNFKLRSEYRSIPGIDRFGNQFAGAASAAWIDGLTRGLSVASPGLPLQLLHRWAGRYQETNQPQNYNSADGHWYQSRTISGGYYGDQKQDHVDIRIGFDRYNMSPISRE